MNDDHHDSNGNNGDESFAELLEQNLGRSVRLELGQKIEATILQIGSEWAFLDVGQKGEGVLDVKELLDAEGNFTVETGATVTVYFLSREGGELRFTTRLGGGTAGTAQLEEAWRSGVPVDGRIEKEVKGGYEVKLPGNVRAFCPYSQTGLRSPDDPQEMIGRNLTFKITRFDEQGRNIVVSHREIVEEERQRQREEWRRTLQEGMRVTGTVTSIRDFGAFVDIGGIEGLLPISELAYGRVEDVTEVVQVGQELELAVKRLDWEKNRFSLSLRDTLADPWSGIEQRYRPGDKRTGQVSRLAPFGAFVTLEEGVDGLVHISKLGEGKPIRHPKEVVSVGQELPVIIETIDAAQKRISLVPAAAAEEAVGPSSYRDEPSGAGGLGTFGDLLKAAREKKGKKGR